MKTYLKQISTLVLIFSLTTIVSFGKGYSLNGHSITVTKVDSEPTTAAIQLYNHDSTSVLQIKWQILNDGFQFSGWTYSFCDLAQCYVTSYPNSATDALAKKTDGAFNVTVTSFKNIASSATMLIKVWDPTDPTNSDTISLTINATRLGIINPELSDNSISIYPVPAIDHLSLQINQTDFKPVKAIIYDMLGRSMSVSNISDKSNNIPVFDLPKGNYMLIVRDQNGRVANKEFTKE